MGDMWTFFLASVLMTLLMQILKVWRRHCSCYGRPAESGVPRVTSIWLMNVLEWTDSARCFFSPPSLSRWETEEETPTANPLLDFDFLESSLPSTPIDTAAIIKKWQKGEAEDWRCMFRPLSAPYGTSIFMENLSWNSVIFGISGSRNDMIWYALCEKTVLCLITYHILVTFRFAFFQHCRQWEWHDAATGEGYCGGCSYPPVYPFYC